jgi:hypothetical protein
MVNYQLGKIYLIVSKKNKLIYIGSTAQKYLSTRLGGHVREFEDGKTSCTSCEVIACDDYDIQLIKNFSCSNKKQLQREEGFWILKYKEDQSEFTCVNDRIAGRTWEEWYKANKEEILAKNREYRQTHKEEISAIQKIWYETHKEERKEYRQEYYEIHKEEILAQRKEHYKIHREEKQEYSKEYSKEYYKNNADKLKEKFVCEICGGKFTFDNKRKHIKSNKHKQALTNN